MPTTVALAAPAVHLQAAAGLPEGVELGPTLAILGAIFLVTLALRGLPFAALRFFRESDLVAWLGPVSYTHLTLPTTRLVCRSRWSPDH